jgi:hypothetical protein
MTYSAVLNWLAAALSACLERTRRHLVAPARRPRRLQPAASSPSAASGFGVAGWNAYPRPKPGHLVAPASPTLQMKLVSATLLRIQKQFHTRDQKNKPHKGKHHALSIMLTIDGIQSHTLGCAVLAGCRKEFGSKSNLVAPGRACSPTTRGSTSRFPLAVLWQQLMRKRQ